MFDNLNAHDDREKPGRGEARQEHERLSDREVPLGGTRTPALVHAWLDGEASEASLRQGDAARHVEFWGRIAAEADVRRQVKTPPYLARQIMEALPKATSEVTEAWWQRQVAFTPVIAIAIATALLTLGALVGLGLR